MSRYTVSINVYEKVDNELVYIAGAVTCDWIDNKTELEHTLKRTGLEDEVVRDILSKVKDE